MQQSPFNSYFVLTYSCSESEINYQFIFEVKRTCTGICNILPLPYLTMIKKIETEEQNSKSHRDNIQYMYKWYFPQCIRGQILTWSLWFETKHW